MKLNYTRFKELSRKAVSNPEKIIPALKDMVLDRSVSSNISKIRESSVVWHVCTPKSASTFFMNYCHKTLIEHSNKFQLINSIPFYENRPQVTCSFTICQHLNRNKLNILKHQHVIATKDTLQMISDNHVVICQTRSILDTIVSLVDHITKHPIQPFSPVAAHYWDQLNDEQKLLDVIENYLPWHIAFLQSWLVASESCNVQWLDYSDAVSEPNKYIDRAVSKFGISSQDFVDLEIEKSNFNKGIAGRGRETIPLELQEKITDKIRMSDHLGHNLIQFL